MELLKQYTPECRGWPDLQSGIAPAMDYYMLSLGSGLFVCNPSPWRRRSEVEVSPVSARDATRSREPSAAIANPANSDRDYDRTLSGSHRELIISLVRLGTSARNLLRTILSSRRRPDLPLWASPMDAFRKAPATSTEYSRAPSLRTCRCSRPSRLVVNPGRRRCSASPCRQSLLARADEVIE